VTIAQTFAQLRQRDELAFIPYQTAGFPSLRESLENLRLLAENGADLLELGIPFCDPIADGPTIQYASHVALEGGVSLRAALDALKDIELPCPLVLMSYINPLLAFGRERLFPAVRDAGAAGLIIPDLPAEEADDWLAAAREHEISLVFLLAPTSTPERIRRVAELTDGFIYAVSLTGTTGAREQLAPGLPGFLKKIKGATDKPVAVGFGISRPQQIRALRGAAEGVVVASRIIEAIHRGEDWTGLVRTLKAATKERQQC
jgi:tryptophan synthase alpha chain